MLFGKQYLAVMKMKAMKIHPNTPQNVEVDADTNSASITAE